ncbi:hypothetical protein ACVOMV_16110 [Mesorhizobium atlanticum]
MLENDTNSRGRLAHDPIHRRIVVQFAFHLACPHFANNYPDWPLQRARCSEAKKALSCLTGCGFAMLSGAAGGLRLGILRWIKARRLLAG